jgi:putative transposase
LGHFFQWLRGHSLDGVKLIVGDKCIGMLEAVDAELRTMKLNRQEGRGRH